MVAFLLSRDRVPSIEIVDKIAKALNVPAWQLLYPPPIDNDESELIDVFRKTSDQGRLMLMGTVEFLKESLLDEESGPDKKVS